MLKPLLWAVIALALIIAAFFGGVMFERNSRASYDAEWRPIIESHRARLRAMAGYAEVAIRVEPVIDRLAEEHRTSFILPPRSDREKRASFSALVTVMAGELRRKDKAIDDYLYEALRVAGYAFSRDDFDLLNELSPPEP